jgi:hypothetical protein
VAYITTFAHPVFLVRWTAPVVEDMPDVTAEFMRRRKTVRHPLVYVAIVPENCVSPNDATRSAMVRERDLILPECQSMYIVMEGTGFKNAILRNALAAMQLVVGKRDKKVVISRTLEEALFGAARQAPADLRFDVRSVLATALADGVATPRIAASGS